VALAVAAEEGHLRTSAACLKTKTSSVDWRMYFI
jgi:hypothetical protein